MKGKSYNIYFPKTVTIGCLTYKVKYFKFSEHARNDGLFLGASSVIKITKENSLQYAAYIYLHEIFHAIDYVYFTSSLDEDTIIILSKSWYNFIVSNIFDFSKYEIPKFVDICGFKYKVGFSDIINKQSLSTVLSSVNTSDQIILVDDSVIQDNEKPSKERLISAFLESVSVAMATEYNYKNNECMDGMVYSQLGNAVYQVFRDNKIDKLIKQVARSVV